MNPAGVWKIRRLGRCIYASVRGVASKAFRIPTTATIHQERPALCSYLYAQSSLLIMLIPVITIIGENRGIGGGTDVTGREGRCPWIMDIGLKSAPE